MENQNYQNNGNNINGPGGQNNGNVPGGNGNNGQGPNDNGPGKGQSLMVLLIASLIVLLGMSYLMRALGDDSNKEITYNEFLDMESEFFQ